MTFPPEKVTEALVLMAAAGGKTTDAQEQLGVPEVELLKWKKTTHAAQYREIEERYGRELEAQLISQARANARRAGEVEADLIERMAKASDREAPQALRAITDAKTKNVDKLLALTGRPSQITESRDMGAILKGLERLNVLRVVDSTATEVAEDRSRLSTNDQG